MFEYNQFPYVNANDDNYDTFAHTQTSKYALLKLDFGKNIMANKVRIVFRNKAVERDTNILLIATNDQGQGVFEVTHTRYCKEMSMFYPKTSIITSNTISNWK